MRLWRIVTIFKRAVWAWCEDNALRLGASLACYTPFAIATVLLVAIAIARLAFGPEAVRGQIVAQLEALGGRDGAQADQSMLEGTSRPQSGWLATVVGSITFVFAATGAFLELQTVLNTIWRVKPTCGAAGSVIVLLLWVCYSTQIMPLGAQFTRIYAETHGSRPRAGVFAEPDPAAPLKAS